MAKYNIDYYNVLEIDKLADLETIRNAYRNLAKKYHPDTCQILSKKEAEEKFKLISEAYDVLSDSNKRERYDLAIISKEIKKKNNEENTIKRQAATNWSADGFHYEAFGCKPTNKYYTPDKAKQRVERIIVLSKIGVAFLLVILFIAFGIIADKKTKNIDQSQNVVQQTNKPVTLKKEYFTLGSTKQKVINVMGIPYEDNSYSYEYRNSSVYFNQKGIVVGWNNVNNELNVFLAKPDDNAPLISVGSTKSEVINTMGTPSFINKNIWRYGKSYVLFDARGKVKNWKDISDNLRVAD